MALRVAIASGNWSNPAIWNGGVLPTVGDIVASNTFTVTINQNINVDSITNSAQAVAGAVPNMTSNTAPSGIVTASQSETGYFAAFNAFGGDFNTEWRPSGAAWIAYEFTSPKAIDQYSVGTYGGTGDWTFEGWNGSSWIVLHTVTNTSSSYSSPSIGNSVAFIKYRLNYSISAPSRLHTIQFYEYLGTTAAVAGGGFILNDGVTVTCTGSGVVTGTTTCLTYSGSGVSTINANIFPANANTGAGECGLIYSGSGTLNINGNIQNIGISVTRGPTVLFSGTGTLNITGNINALQVVQALRITNTSVCNIVGDLNPGNSAVAVQVTGNAIVNITGNIFPQQGGSPGASLLLISAAAAVVTVTGNVYPDTTFVQNAHGISVTSSSQLYIIGTVNGGSGSFNTVISSTNCFISIIGSIKSQRGVPAFQSTGTGAINILTGPFISGDSGNQPLYVTRMHYRRTLGSYYEFRDNSTLGALPPSPSAPATRLVSPDTVADSPIPANVRQGTSYAAGSQTGTMIVPSRDNVAKGVLVDNTTGTAILDADAIWAVPLTSINTLNSIGRRVKNAATVETTGAQIQQTLNNNE
jgi:hypothetical protein